MIHWRGYAWAFLFVSIALLSGCSNAGSADNPLDASHIPPLNTDFQEHREALREYLQKTQLPQRGIDYVDYNLPFEFFPNSQVTYRGKFLLIHGLNDSPFVWRDIAKHLANRGFHVRAILLPGHGNTPAAQLDISYKDWTGAAQRHFDVFNAAKFHSTTNASVSNTSTSNAETEEKFYIGGFSLGGVIATLLAHNNSEVDGLLLLSPAFKSQMHSMLRWAGIYSTFKPWVFGGMIIEDNPVKYNSIPINGAYQYFKTTQALKKVWPKNPLSIPVLMVASQHDSVVDIEHMMSSYRRGFNGSKQLIVYADETSTLSEPTAHTPSHQRPKNLASSTIEYRTASFPELRILNQSHQSVLISNENALYGSDGKTLVCNGNEWPVFSACLYYRGKHWFGAQHTESPDGVPVARTTFNPDLEYVLTRIDELLN